MATRTPRSLGTKGHFDHYALSALGNLIELVPGPMAQAFTFRAFGAAKLSFDTGSTASGSLPTKPMSLIETQEVTRVYQMGTNLVTALDHVDVSLDEGEFVAIQGTSGSGKSTLLNLLGGLDRPTSGEVLFDSTPLGPLTKKQMARYRRDSVGMIFQNFNLITTMTAAENVRLALAFGAVRGAERRQRAGELLERVGLAGRTEHRPLELSGGEQQRVAIARALANRPRVLLADEPTGNLDSTRARELLALLHQMVEREGLTVLLVTHDRELASSFADRIIMMKDGQVVSG